MMIPRNLESELKQMFKEYPIVTITGPRQSGKTTLARHSFPKLAYVNLEKPDVRLMAQSDPNSFLEKYKNGAIFDEIQRVPTLLSYIQVLVDEQNKEGQFILTGSNQLTMIENVAQSLAGRTAILKLLPFSINELSKVSIEYKDTNNYLYKGGFPRIYDKKQNPTKAYRNYLETYIEKDLRQVLNIKDLDLFQRFMKMVAARVGQLLNATSIGNELGVSNHTVKHWLSVLETTFIIFKITPYFNNFNKRIVKSPKIYFVDPGLATYLLGINDLNQLSRDPLRGQLFENLVVLEFIKHQFNKGLDHNLYFFRDNTGNEVDLIFTNSSYLFPVEIKSSSTYSPQFCKTIKLLQKWGGERVKEGTIVYSGDEEISSLDNCSVINFRNIHKFFHQRLFPSP
ncbi:MAG: ATP-binding protein [Bacteriovoracaceae bacterium]|nr:ATP-binding protein [Bacteriovoracaceae bacterium]